MPDGASYPFTGYAATGFPDYVDLDTGQMLVAEPGGSYRIRAVNEGHPVPPADGRWAEASAPPPQPPLVAPLVPPEPPPPPPDAAPEPAGDETPEGGE